MRNAMWRLLVLSCLVLGLTDAARRTRPTTTSTAPTPLESEGRQLPFAGQPEELENLWDNLDIQKLENRPDWRKTTIPPNISSDFYGQGPGRQFYPGSPNNPGDTNELPSPIVTRPPPPPPVLPPGCLGPRGQFPSPKSCANYLNCWDDVVIEQTCPNGLLFNDRNGVCDFDFNVNCGSRPLPTPKPPLTPGSKRCPEPNGRYRSSTNCSEFYMCVVGRPIKFSCPRGLVYNDILNVCDYPYNVDCQGAATPKPQPPPTQGPHQPSKPPTNPPQTYPPQPPTSPTQQPTYPTSQQPSYPTSQQPSYPTPIQPSYPPQQPSYPSQQPSYPAQQPGYPGAGYPGGNPWLSKTEPDYWQQRTATGQVDEEEEEQQEQEDLSSSSESVSQEPQDTTVISNPWNLQTVPASLSKVPCENGEIHRLTESCSSVVVCRSGRPQLVQCPTGFTYDKPSDSCKPFTLAKC